MKKQVVKRNVVVESALTDGSLSMAIGTLERRTAKAIFLTNASFIAHTGRRSEFFAGRFDAQVEIEPYPDAMLIEFPAVGARVYDWPHALPRTVK